MSKGSPKTMRFSSDVESYIEAFKGDNFSDSLHQMVRHFRDQENFYTARLDKLKKEIQEKEGRLSEINTMMRDVQWLDTALDNLKKDIARSRDCFDAFVLRNTKSPGSQELLKDNCITPDKYKMRKV